MIALIWLLTGIGHSMPTLRAADQYVEDCNAAMAAIPDRDGDGVDDLIIGDANSLGGRGQVWLVSGRTGAVQGHLVGRAEREGFGDAVAAIGDVDGDGLCDCAVWCRRGEDGTHPLVLIVAGKDPRVLREIEGASESASINSMGTMGDLDGDGFADFFVANDADNDAGWRTGQVRVYSGATGKALSHISGSLIGDHLGCAALSIGDLNGDGVRDLLVSMLPSQWDGSHATADQSTVHRPDCVMALSGKDLHVIYKVREPHEDTRFGWSIAAMDDQNGDGVPEFAVGAAGSGDLESGPGGEYVCIHSGRDGALITTIRGNGHESFGAALSAVADLDGDHADDLIVGATYGGADVAGTAYAYSSRKGSLIRAIRASRGDEHFGCAVVALSAKGIGGERGDFLAVRTCNSSSDSMVHKIRVLGGADLRMEYEIAFKDELHIQVPDRTGSKPGK